MQAQQEQDSMVLTAMGTCRQNHVDYASAAQCMCRIHALRRCLSAVLHCSYTAQSVHTVYNWHTSTPPPYVS
eukprot:18795-Heterococcus_DN1.PRE.2